MQAISHKKGKKQEEESCYTLHIRDSVRPGRVGPRKIFRLAPPTHASRRASPTNVSVVGPNLLRRSHPPKFAADPPWLRHCKYEQNGSELSLLRNSYVRHSDLLRHSYSRTSLPNFFYTSLQFGFGRIFTYLLWVLPARQHTLSFSIR